LGALLGYPISKKKVNQNPVGIPLSVNFTNFKNQKLEAMFKEVTGILSMKVKIKKSGNTKFW
jgi:hypothetical protein